MRMKRRRRRRNMRRRMRRRRRRRRTMRKRKSDLSERTDQCERMQLWKRCVTENGTPQENRTQPGEKERRKTTLR
jgi:hypothetical protein